MHSRSLDILYPSLSLPRICMAIKWTLENYISFPMVLDKIVQGSLLDATEPYIAHQCNCVTVKSHGISTNIFAKFKYADVYAKRAAIKNGSNRAKYPDIPGTIDVSVSQIVGEPSIIAMFAQYAPGSSGVWKFLYPTDIYVDSIETRLKWFKECLGRMDLYGIDKVAMPYRIGCGLAKGKWSDYLNAIKASEIHITLYECE
jgi:hypothetical protein